MKPIRTALLLTFVLLTVGLQANEGMWMPQQIPALAAKLRAHGFVGDPKSFADLTGQPMGAIVSLGGCTASFVSPDGLIVTESSETTVATDEDGYGLTYLFGDGWVKYADTKQGLLLVRWPASS